MVPGKSETALPAFFTKLFSLSLSGFRQLQQCPGPKGKLAARLERQGRTHLPVGEVQVLIHVHLERGSLQSLQVDDAILGASDLDVIHCEEAVTASICLEGNRL